MIHISSAIVLWLTLFTITGANAAVLIPDETGRIAMDQLKQTIESAQRPCVLITSGELDSLRNDLRKDGWRRRLYVEEVSNEYSGTGVLPIANRWLKEKIEIPERGGHGHNFFCDCGTQLTLPDDMRPKSEYVCPKCGKRYSGDKFDAAVRLFRHHQLANASLVLALAYAIEGDRSYADKASEILLGYAKAYPGPHTGVTTGGILQQSLNEAMWVIPLAQAYDLVYDSGSLTQSRKHLIEDHLFRPVAEGLMNCETGGNWRTWHLSAVGVIGFAIKDVPMVDYALKGLTSQIRSVLGDDGLWPESVHCYHFFALSAFVYFAEACRGAGIDLYDWEGRPGKSLKLAFTAPLDYVYPDFRLPAVNDGWYESRLPLNLYEAAYHKWQDPRFAWVLKNGYDLEKSYLANLQHDDLGYLAGPALYRFLFRSQIPENVSPPAFESRDYPNFGVCTLRNKDGLMATFHYGRFLGHGHLDKMSFTLFANGSLLIPDYGTPGYGSKILRWYQGTMGHNTVVVDGKNQAPSKQSELTAFGSEDSTQSAEAISRDAYPGVTHTRKLILQGNVLVIIDTLASDQEHDYDWIVRCEGKPEIVGRHTPTNFDTTAYSAADFRHKETLDGGYRINWRTGSGGLAFAIWSDLEDGSVGIGDCPAETAARRSSFLVCRRHGTKARFVSVFVPSKSPGGIRISRQGDVVEVSEGDRIDHIELTIDRQQ